MDSITITDAQCDALHWAIGAYDFDHWEINEILGVNGTIYEPVIHGNIFNIDMSGNGSYELIEDMIDRLTTQYQEMAYEVNTCESRGSARAAINLSKKLKQLIQSE